jgi:esterase/lipase
MKTNMLLIEQKVIEEIKYDDNSVNISHLIGHSKEVEVVDIKTSWKDWYADMKSFNNYRDYLINNGYQLIKIKQ